MVCARSAVAQVFPDLVALVDRVTLGVGLLDVGVGLHLVGLVADPIRGVLPRVGNLLDDGFRRLLGVIDEPPDLLLS